MANNEIKGVILSGGLIKLTTDLISDPALHVEAEAFVKAVEKDSGGTFKVTAKKGGKVAHSHTDALGNTTTHSH
jgi:hypothetical protein